jgi:predicted PurR-regulated permease PerM
MPNRPLSVTITTGTVIKTLVVLAAAWLVYTLFDLVLVLLTAIVIASAIEPAARWFVERHVPRVVAVLIVFLAFLSVIFGIFYLFIPVFLSEVASLVGALSSYIDTFTRSPGDYVSILGAAESTGFSVSVFKQCFFCR